MLDLAYISILKNGSTGTPIHSQLLLARFYKKIKEELQYIDIVAWQDHNIFDTRRNRRRPSRPGSRFILRLTAIDIYFI
jgi:hypothetical protein